MKKIILGVVAVVVIGLLGRLVWAYQAVKQDDANAVAAQSALAAQAAKAKADAAKAAALLASIPKAPEGCPSTRQQSEVWVAGKVVFPKGIKTNTGYSILSNLATYPVNSDGTFCVITPAGIPTVITATATTTASSFVLSAIVNSSIDVQDFLINATSTAMALVYSNPLVTPSSNPNILEAIATSTAVSKFATSISTATTLSNKDIATGGKLATVYTNAVKSIKSVPLQTVAAPTTTTPAMYPTTGTTAPKPVTTPVTTAPAPTTMMPAPTTTTTPTPSPNPTPAPTTQVIPPTTTTPIPVPVPGVTTTPTPITPPTPPALTPASTTPPAPTTATTTTGIPVVAPPPGI